jgi:hypothetical protein
MNIGKSAQNDWDILFHKNQLALYFIHVSYLNKFKKGRILFSCCCLLLLQLLLHGVRPLLNKN